MIKVQTSQLRRKATCSHLHSFLSRRCLTLAVSSFIIFVVCLVNYGNVCRILEFLLERARPAGATGEDLCRGVVVAKYRRSSRRVCPVTGQVAPLPPLGHPVHLLFLQRDKNVPAWRRQYEVECRLRSVEERGIRVWQEAVVVVVNLVIDSTVDTRA